MAARKPNEDLFDSSRMSFGQHLEELRKVLFRALIWLGIGCAISFWFAEKVVRFLEKPLVEAIGDYDLQKAQNKLVERDGFLGPEFVPWLEQERVAPQQVMIDPGQLVAALQSVIPDFGEQVELNSYGFKPAHFDREKLPALANRLAKQSGESADVSARLKAIWSRLTSEEQGAVQRIAESSSASGTDLIALISSLDRVSSLEELYKDAAFESLLSENSGGFWSFLQPKQENHLAKIKEKLDEKFNLDLGRRLNRVLITDLFPDQMSAVRMDMMPIEIWRYVEVEPQALTATEAFLIWVKAGLIFGLVLASPFIFYELWSFVASGLYPHEKKYVYIFMPFSMGLFFAGACLAFFFVFKPVLSFLFSFNSMMGISIEPRINDWLSFVMFLPVGFGIAFQLPLVMLFMNRIGLFSVEAYLTKWRIAVMCIFVVAMILTPADPISMILLAVPLTLLYFLGIGLCKWMPSNRNPYSDVIESPTS